MKKKTRMKISLAFVLVLCFSFIFRTHGLLTAVGPSLNEQEYIQSEENVSIDNRNIDSVSVDNESVDNESIDNGSIEGAKAEEISTVNTETEAAPAHDETTEKTMLMTSNEEIMNTENVNEAESSAERITDIPDNWTNVAKNKFVTASSEQRDSQAEYAVDGISNDRNNRWRSNSKNEAHNLTIYLGDEYTINGARYELGYLPNEWAVKSNRLEYWDGSAWVTIPGSAIEENSDNTITLKFNKPIKTNVVRYSSDDATRGLRIREIEIYTEDFVENYESDATDTEAATLEHESLPYSILQGNSFDIEVKSNEFLSNIYVLLWNTAAPGEVRKINLNELSPGQYGVSLNLDKLGEYAYAIYAQDNGANVSVLPEYNSTYTFSIVERAAQPEIGFNIENGDVISGEIGLLAYTRDFNSANSLQVKLGDRDLGTSPALPNPAKLRFQGRSIDVIYRTAISAYEDGQRQFQGQIINNDGLWYSFDIDPKYLLANEQTLSIHTGTDSVTYEPETHDQYWGKANFDDFYFSKVNMILPSGEIIEPPVVTYHRGDKEVVEHPYSGQEILVADHYPDNVYTHWPLMVDLNFQIDNSNLTAAYSKLDTRQFADGEYELKKIYADGREEIINVTIDNELPVVEEVLINGEVLKSGDKVRGNNLTLDFTSNKSKEDLQVQAQLNGEEIILPYEFSSLDLDYGQHELIISLVDKTGNRNQQEWVFVVEDDRADIDLPNDHNTAISVDKNNPVVNLNIDVPSGDKVKVEFFKGQKIDVNTGDVDVYSGVATSEPPRTLSSAGETRITDTSNLVEQDDKFLSTEETTGFPYQRYELNLADLEIKAGENFEFVWHGGSMQGRKVSLYIWNPTLARYDLFDAQIANGEDSFDLSVNVELETYLDADKKLNILVQDELLNNKEEFNLLWVTDTQYYAKSYPQIYNNLYNWIVHEYKDDNFEYMIHTGDIIDNMDSPAEWEIADRNHRKLDENNVPYGVLAGNHDVILGTTQDYSKYQEFFGDVRFSDRPWFAGSMDNNRNHYDLVSIGGTDLIILYIGFGTENDPDTVAWANQVLAEHSDKNAIVAMHAYLETDGRLSAMSEEFLNNVVVPNENIKMILCGHYHSAKHNFRTIQNEDGTTREVVEVLFNPQSGINGGDGFIRLLTFNPKGNTLRFRTFSPIINSWSTDTQLGEENNNINFGSEDDFTVRFDFQDPRKAVYTDYITLDRYTNEFLGGEDSVEDGDKVSLNLNADQLLDEDFAIYMKLTDEISNINRTRVYRVRAAEQSGDTTEQEKQKEDTRDDVPGDYEPGENTIPIENNPAPSDKGEISEVITDPESTGKETSNETIPVKQEDTQEQNNRGITATGESARGIVLGMAILMISTGSLLKRKKTR